MATAFLRSFTERRGRNPSLAEKAITEGSAYTEKEALDGKMIDLIVNSPDELVRQLDGGRSSDLTAPRQSSLKKCGAHAF